MSQAKVGVRPAWRQATVNPPQPPQASSAKVGESEGLVVQVLPQGCSGVGDLQETLVSFGATVLRCRVHS